ncbi:vanw family protein, partial [bacterium]
MITAMADVPRRWDSLVFTTKAGVLHLRRAARNLREPVPLHGRGEPLSRILAEVRTPLYEGKEPEMELGKAQNLRLVATRLDGLRIPAGETFSFWRQVGRCTRRRGFVRGREIRQGCVVPSIGGGICSITNALYEAALTAGLEVVERHPHTRVIPGSAAERGMDATVSWNYLDLRMRAAFDWEISVRLTRNESVVTIRGEAPGVARRSPLTHLSVNSVGDCATCEQDGCFRHRDRPQMIRSRTAYWVDEVWPEFAAYVDEREEADLLFAPMDGARW